jgi:hypothetical protein
MNIEKRVCVTWFIIIVYVYWFFFVFCVYSRKNLMEQQGYKCAGCGTKVAVKYASKFRYCFYLGRYFCTGCHVNKTAVIPGRIIAKWDFSKYVSRYKVMCNCGASDSALHDSIIIWYPV